MPLLEIRGLTKFFGGLCAVKNLNFAVENGEIVGLIGPNGSGKTTVFNCISGIYRPSSGLVKFKGQDVTGLAPHEVCRRGIGRTFQIVRTFQNLTVLQNVMGGFVALGSDLIEARSKAKEILNFMGMSSLAEIPTKALTLANRKKVELARALGTNPKLLLLDECMAGLNMAEIDEMLKLIKEINKKGVTLVVVEHVMKAIMNLAERIVVLHNGEKIAEGTPKEISTDERVIEAYLGRAFSASGG
jgi:branched-chain amino acid transport system ATP-binding protein